ncbi:MAG: hypothetical protein ACNA78_08735, partial [Balneolaceae bacterium]
MDKPAWYAYGEDYFILLILANFRWPILKFIIWNRIFSDSYGTFERPPIQKPSGQAAVPKTAGR